jgi:hypothetical protein
MHCGAAQSRRFVADQRKARAYSGFLSESRERFSETRPAGR